MSSKRYKKLPEDTKNLPSNSFEKLLPLDQEFIANDIYMNQNKLKVK